MGTLVIAEAGVNHNGSPETALAMIDAAAAAGADVVKFQTFRAADLATAAAGKADYQKAATGGAESQQDMLRRLELSADAHHALIEHCRRRGIGFLSTPFDAASAVFLRDELALPCFKLSSGDLTNAPLLLLLARARPHRDIILSAGMAGLGEVEEALGVLAFGYTAAADAAPGAAAFRAAFRSPEGAAMLRERVTLLHCTTEYPAPMAQTNLRVMATLRAAFGVRVGFSDHTPGIAAALAAVALGAEVIEKHFTLDRTLPGPDHAASLEPAELRALVAGIRDVEAALGDGRKIPTTGEGANAAVARKSIVAARPIRCGESYSLDNLTTKRPGTGLPPIRLWDLLGRPAGRDYAADDAIEG